MTALRVRHPVVGEAGRGEPLGRLRQPVGSVSVIVHSGVITRTAEQQAESRVLSR